MTETGRPIARIQIATPSYDGSVHHRFVESLTAAMMYCLYHLVELEINFVSGATLIQYARNQLLREFLADESLTHLMWIDADVGFDPRAIMQLLEHDKDVVGGVYPMKSVPMGWPYSPMPHERTPGLHRARVMPGGFLLCTRAAMQAVAERAPSYYHHIEGQKHRTPHVFELALEGDVLLGEDVILCRRLQEAGFDVWVDPDIAFSHHGQFTWRGKLGEAIARGDFDFEMSPALFAGLKSDDADTVMGACEDLHRRWGNGWTPPPLALATLAHLARDAEQILEAGSGLSTIIMAAANPNAHIHALESDPAWVERMRAEIQAAGLGNVTVHHAPLEADYCYGVPEGLPPRFDLVFVDGPAFLRIDGRTNTDTRRPFYRKFAAHIAGAALVIDDLEHYRDIAARYRHEEVGDRFAICAGMLKEEAA